MATNRFNCRFSAMLTSIDARSVLSRHALSDVISTVQRPPTWSAATERRRHWTGRSETTHGYRTTTIQRLFVSNSDRWNRTNDDVVCTNERFDCLMPTQQLPLPVTWHGLSDLESLSRRATTVYNIAFLSVHCDQSPGWRRAVYMYIYGCSFEYMAHLLDGSRIQSRDHVLWKELFYRWATFTFYHSLGLHGI